jgi:hypothetical protein
LSSTKIFSLLSLFSSLHIFRVFISYFSFLRNSSSSLFLCFVPFAGFSPASSKFGQRETTG